MNPSEGAYETTYREFLAVLWAVLLLRVYLKGARFTIRTNHDALRLIPNMTEATRKFARWRIRFSELYYNVFHRSGVNNQASDAFYRLERKGSNDTELNDQLPNLVMEGKKEEEY